ncbi:DUF1365 domain-containing protein [Alkalimonas delamerensis]|uniref:DUF1365 domain-containing protein n=1 Tax=Alkalimonas delamerensis TaxID=265981 RepID=A0ABT9GPZ1_9GAMM|nr:DUF1365 domain-containing protein [Alkalimonas delamerensis]MDP4528850.1 DUF1365 domain-containing protein [Alkalimonas delamerensis]
MTIEPHALYQGELGHQRLLPKRHGFAYPLHYFWLNASSLPSLGRSWLLKYEGFAAFSYRRNDYLPGAACLKQAVCDKIRQLGGDQPVTEVYLLSPLANWGHYFSPLTLYYGFDAEQQLRYLLAEVSNTPWNERHHYLIPVSANGRYQHDKDFHVSPFNPIAMQYHWQIEPPGETLVCSISNHQQQQKVFSAWMRLQRQPLSAKVLRRMLIRSPWPNVLVKIRIYWHALKLLIKGNPVYAHSKKGSVYDDVTD